LIFCNQTPKDILIRKDIDSLAASSKGQLKVLYVVDKNETNDANIKHVGYVTADFLSSVLPAPSSDALVYVCGPPPMLKSVAGNKKFEKGKPPAQGEVGGILKDLGYTEDMVYKF
jgi:cytochrome-b5 reductase